jgi:hypothetical protein
MVGGVFTEPFQPETQEAAPQAGPIAPRPGDAPDVLGPAGIHLDDTDTHGFDLTAEPDAPFGERTHRPQRDREEGDPPPAELEVAGPIMRVVALMDGGPPGRQVERCVDGDERRGGFADGVQDLAVREKVGRFRVPAAEKAKACRPLG